MRIDLSKLQATFTADTAVQPRELFSVLPEKSKEYGYLRDVQAEVLDSWFVRRNDKDLRIKMNTGGGKTLVGLLLLKSCLNEHFGPAAFVTPSKYLSNQVTQEAQRLGIAVDDNPRSSAVARGRAILVTHVHKIFNGRSVFGVAPEPALLDLGSVVVDDAHACLESVESQFRVTISSDHDAYGAIWEILRADLLAYDQPKALDVAANEPHRLLLVPFWVWQARLKQVAACLHEHRDDDSLQFTWPLISACLADCHCVFGDGAVEISPPCIPIHAIPSFQNARRRIFMSATFADDRILVTHFDASPATIRSPIVPGSASDLGERIIIVPQDISPNIEDQEIREEVAALAAENNVVVIVPSNAAALRWPDSARRITAENLAEVVTELKRGHVGLVILINKYDGIDLPHDACRILVLDGLPDVRSHFERLRSVALQNSPHAKVAFIQRIEQGMGRGVRSRDDYCGVILMGRTLVGQLFAGRGVQLLSPATRAQLSVSERVLDQLRGASLTDIMGAIDLCLDRDPTWTQLAKESIVHLRHTDEGGSTEVAEAQRAAFASFYNRDAEGAVARLRAVADRVEEPVLKGWLLFEVARYLGDREPAEAQRALAAAIRLNQYLPVRPREGVPTRRVNVQVGQQSERAITWLSKEFGSPANAQLALRAEIDQLAFRPDSFKEFESALEFIGNAIGLPAQRPELEFGSGPDVLWCVGDGEYIIIECKNEAIVDVISKQYADQLSGAVSWFEREYKGGRLAAAVMAHPSRTVAGEAAMPANGRVIPSDQLERLRSRLSTFAGSALNGATFCTSKEIGAKLVEFGLTPDLLLEQITVAPR